MAHSQRDVVNDSSIVQKNMQNNMMNKDTTDYLLGLYWNLPADHLPSQAEDLSITKCSKDSSKVEVSSDMPFNNVYVQQNISDYAVFPSFAPYGFGTYNNSTASEIQAKFLPHDTFSPWNSTKNSDIPVAHSKWSFSKPKLNFSDIPFNKAPGLKSTTSMWPDVQDLSMSGVDAKHSGVKWSSSKSASNFPVSFNRQIMSKPSDTSPWSVGYDSLTFRQQSTYINSKQNKAKRSLDFSTDPSCSLNKVVPAKPSVQSLWPHTPIPLASDLKKKNSYCKNYIEKVFPYWNPGGDEVNEAAKNEDCQNQPKPCIVCSSKDYLQQKTCGCREENLSVTEKSKRLVAAWLEEYFF